ncbi:hypothetical protein K491DRAFT_578124, partial [Lophiostoma macrostomum CBS 122681]
STLLPYTTATDDSSVAVSLNSFTPRLDNLPPACDTVYRQQITGCTANDFLTKQCTTPCINGLIAIQHLVIDNCHDASVSAGSVIGAFRSGSGIPWVCSNVVISTTPPDTATQTSAPAQASSSGAPIQSGGSQQSTSRSQTSQAPQSSQAATSAAQSSSASATSASTSSTGGIAVDTSVLSTFATSAPGTSTSAKDPQSTNTQKSNQDSGGGSPFDVQA